MAFLTRKANTGYWDWVRICGYDAKGVKTHHLVAGPDKRKTSVARSEPSLAGRAGVQPATFALGVRRSMHLSYRPRLPRLYRKV